jgi:hypothetical protein
MEVPRHRQYLILQQVSLLVLPYLDAWASKKRPANHPLRYTPPRWLLPGARRFGLWNSRPACTKGHCTASLCPQTQGGRRFAILQPAVLAARIHCRYPSHASASLSPLTQVADGSPSCNLRLWQHASTVIIPPTHLPRSPNRPRCPIRTEDKSRLPNYQLLQK